MIAIAQQRRQNNLNFKNLHLNKKHEIQIGNLVDSNIETTMIAILIWNSWVYERSIRKYQYIISGCSKLFWTPNLKTSLCLMCNCNLKFVMTMFSVFSKRFSMVTCRFFCRTGTKSFDKLCRKLRILRKTEEHIQKNSLEQFQMQNGQESNHQKLKSSA